MDTYSLKIVSNNLIMMKSLEKCKNKDILTLQTNDELKTFSYTASLHIFNLRVNYNPDSIETILSLKDT